MLPGGSTEYLEGSRKPLFSFGHGLSYCEFRYENLLVKAGDNKYEYEVILEVTNLGTRTAEEVVQIYVEDLQSTIVTPEKLLKAFKRIKLLPGETKVIKLKLDFDSFKLLDRNYNWVVEPGDFCIMAGSSSDDIRLSQIISIQ